MPKITTSNTAGEGDCAFHAIFGEFINGKFYYNDVAAKRKEISKLIARCQEPPVNQELFAAVKVGLTEMHDLKPEEQNACPAIMKLRNFVNTVPLSQELKHQPNYFETFHQCLYNDCQNQNQQ